MERYNVVFNEELRIVTQAYLGIKPLLREEMSNEQLREYNSGLNLALTLNNVELTKRQNEKIRKGTVGK